MASRDPVIEIQIRTQADTTGVDKAEKSLTKLETTGDALDQQTKRTKAAFDALEQSIKSAGTASDVAANQMQDAASKGAKASGAISGIGSVIDASQAAQDAAAMGFEIGKTFGDAFARVIDNDWDWTKFFGKAAINDGAAARKKELRELKLAAQEMREELEKEPAGGLLQYMKDLSEAAAQVSKELRAQQEIQGAKNKAEDNAAADDAEDRRNAIKEDDQMGEAEKIKALADLENQLDQEAFNRREERRIQELDNATAELETAQSVKEKADAKAAESKKRLDVAAAIESNDEYQRAQASGADERTLGNIRERLGERAGIGDVGTVKEEKSRFEKTQEEADSAGRKVKDEVRESETLREKQDIERNDDRRGVDRRRDQRGKRAERDIGEAETKGDSKAMEEAGQEARKAGEATEQGTDDLRDGLKELADMVQGRDKAMAEAFDQMAADLADGASAEELAKIKTAMQTVTQSQNKAFADLGSAVTAQLSAIEASTKIAQEALKKSKELEAKIRSIKTS